MNNYTPHKTKGAITYPCLNVTWTNLAKGLYHMNTGWHVVKKCVSGYKARWETDSMKHHWTCWLTYTLLTHWGRATHICVGKLTIIGSDNGLSPGRRQAIIWTIAGILLIGPLGTNFSEILIEIHTFSFMKMHLKMSSARWRLFCLGVNVLNKDGCNDPY